jgi:hypothetical protein
MINNLRELYNKFTLIENNLNFLISKVNLIKLLITSIK